MIQFYDIFQVSSNAVFELQLSKFFNFKPNCVGNCQNKFRICLSVFQEVPNPDSSCSYGEVILKTETTSNGNILFDNKKVLPVEFNLSAWQVNKLFGLLLTSLGNEFCFGDTYFYCHY